MTSSFLCLKFEIKRPGIIQEEGLSLFNTGILACKRMETYTLLTLFYLLFLKFLWFLWCIVLAVNLLFLLFVLIFSQYFFNFYKDMINNTRNRSNNTTEIQEKNRHVLMFIMVYIGIRCNNQKASPCWSVRVELVCMQYNISDSQALFWCFVLIILRMASLDTIFLCSVGQQARIWS